ncbi:MAG: cytochrome c peroxidase, partial [Archangium sp.]|nr:cytochrome c peroxidase [Archangium sp.]
MQNRSWVLVVGVAVSCAPLLLGCGPEVEERHEAAAGVTGQAIVDLRSTALGRTNSLRTVAAPQPPNLATFVRDRAALRRAGKALFWDRQTGSDGQACASCHFHAGADNRSRNQLNPGFRNTLLPGGDQAFTAGFGPNHQLTANDFPFHKLQDADDRNSAVLFDSNDVVSSQGVHEARFDGLRPIASPGWPADVGFPLPGPFADAFVRSVEPRQTPSVINSVFNHRNFWDGRARNEFNGVNPLGSLEPARVVKVNSGIPSLVHIQIRNASTASQAVGPVLNPLEASFSGRSLPLLGRKLLPARPLAAQEIDPADSVLGGASLTTYAALFEAAMVPAWWSAPGYVVDQAWGQPRLVLLAPGQSPTPTQYTVMEYNFSLFLGLAIGEYERSLIADQSPFDRFMEGDASALDAQQQQGLELFLGKGNCINCHGGAELTNASVRNVQGFQVIERMVMKNNRVAVYDNGFYNIGVRPTAEDLGVGATIGSKNKPLSNSRGFQQCVRETMAKNTWMTLDQANCRCNVPRILARPEEAVKLVMEAAQLAGNPVAVADLLTQADAALAAHPPNLTLASCKLAKNPALLCTDDGALDVLAGLSTGSAFDELLAQAASLLPDQNLPSKNGVLLAPPLQPNERVAVDGAFKTAGLRNIALTAPYFHNGGAATLMQVVEFYNRGGDFANQNQNDLDPDIRPLGLSLSEKEALVAFLVSLTDPRVSYERAPFDHPSLEVPNGGGLAVPFLFDFGSGQRLVLEDLVQLPQVGAAGCSPLCPNGLGSANTPYANFLQKLTPEP